MFLDEKPSQKQLEFLDSLGYKGKTPFSKKKCSELIEKFLLIKSAAALQEKVNFELTENVIAVTKENIGLYSYILTMCVEADITVGAVIGMIYNNTKIDLRLQKIK